MEIQGVVSSCMNRGNHKGLSARRGKADMAKRRFIDDGIDGLAFEADPPRRAVGRCTIGFGEWTGHDGRKVEL